MKPSHPSILLAVLLALLAVPASAAVWREQSEKLVEGRGLREIVVENARGSVTVRRSRDGQVHLSALKVVRVSKRDRAQDLARATEVLASREGERFRVWVRYPQRRSVHLGLWEMLSGFEFPRVDVRLGIDVPSGIDVSLESTSGDLSTEDVGGDQNLESTSGDLSIRSARGRVEARTTSGTIVAAGLRSARLRTSSGDVHVDGAAGPVSVASSSGDIVLRSTEDSIAASTTSGRIHVGAAPRGLTARSTSGSVVARDVSGGVRLETSSGDVRLELVRSPGPTEVSSGSGDVVVRLADAVRCRLDMRTSSGTLDASIPLEIEKVSRHHVMGRVRGGTSLVRLRSSSGDIAVRSGGRP